MSYTKWYPPNSGDGPGIIGWSPGGKSRYINKIVPRLARTSTLVLIIPPVDCPEGWFKFIDSFDPRWSIERDFVYNPELDRIEAPLYRIPWAMWHIRSCYKNCWPRMSNGAYVYAKKHDLFMKLMSFDRSRYIDGGVNG